MKRSDNVRSLATITSTLKIKDKVVAIEPMVLYQRMLFVKKDSNDLAGYFKYGLASYPLALFINTGIKKICKISLVRTVFNCRLARISKQRLLFHRWLLSLTCSELEKKHDL